jgi:hypothetical protein
VLAAVGPLNPPPSSADLNVVRTYFAGVNEVISRVLAFDERAAAHTLKKAELSGKTPLATPFSQAAALRLWSAVSECIDEIQYILQLGESPDDLAIMGGKAEAIHECSHHIDALYREKEAYCRLVLESIKGREKRIPSAAQSRAPSRRGRAKQSLQTDSATKIIACLAQHHGYETSAVNCEPMKSSVLAKRAGVSEATTSRFMARYLSGSKGYRRLCDMGPEALSGRIRRLREEYFEGKRFQGDAPA